MIRISFFLMMIYDMTNLRNDLAFIMWVLPFIIKP